AFGHAEQIINHWFNNARLMEKWGINPKDCIAPIVLNITDGESREFDRHLHRTKDATDLASFKRQLDLIENREFYAAEKLKSYSSDYGHVLLFNIQISDSESVMFPTPERAESFDAYGKLLFTLSSELPEWMRNRAKALALSPESLPES